MLNMLDVTPQNLLSHTCIVNVTKKTPKGTNMSCFGLKDKRKGRKTLFRKAL